jgi:hypothetical protein
MSVMNLATQDRADLEEATETFTKIVNQVTADTEDQNWRAEHMSTHAELHIEYVSKEDPDGNITATPIRAFITGTDRTWTDLVLQGFHGNSQVELEPAAYQTGRHRYGVDGKWIGQSDRTESWYEEVPLSTAQADRLSKGGAMKVTFAKG